MDEIKIDLNTNVSTPPNEVRGKIELIKTSQYKGLVCKCGNHDQLKFAKHLSVVRSKAIDGTWSVGEKTYVRCTVCNNRDIYTKEIDQYFTSMGNGVKKGAAGRKMCGKEATYNERMAKQLKKSVARKKYKLDGPKMG